MQGQGVQAVGAARGEVELIAKSEMGGHCVEHLLVIVDPEDSRIAGVMHARAGILPGSSSMSTWGKRSTRDRET
jgi:hypothetical protein